VHHQPLVVPAELVAAADEPTQPDVGERTPDVGIDLDHGFIGPTNWR